MSTQAIEPRQPAHLIRWASQTHWAMEPHAMENYWGILTRADSDVELAASIREYRAVLLDTGSPLAGARGIVVRDGIAVMPVRGPIFRYSDFFTAYSGGTTVDGLSRNIALALRSPQVHTLVLHVDSPGGEITGIQELAYHIAAARGQGKRIIAYGEGMVCSAAYWLAAACDYILLGPTAIAGSIGVRQVITTSMRDGRFEFVSDQSPDKALDPKTDEGRAKIQATLNQLAAVFVGDVAQYRGVTVDIVLSDFGRGGVLVGAGAVAAGLADGIDTLEGVVYTLARQARRIGYYGGVMGNQNATLHALLEQDPASAGAVLLAESTPASTPAASQPPAANQPPAAAANSDETKNLRAENEQLKQRIAAIEASQEQAARTARTNAINAAVEKHIDAGRFDPQHRASLEGVYSAVYGTPAQAQLDTLLLAMPEQPDGEQVTTTPTTSTTLDRKTDEDYAAAAQAQVEQYNKTTGAKNGTAAK